jgi:hypothetical protein
MRTGINHVRPWMIAIGGPNFTGPGERGAPCLFRLGGDLVESRACSCE